jgi:predicted HD superfamily hydrolase involved in NAD metabolism
LTIDKIMVKLEQSLDYKRFQHSVRVMNESDKLAAHYKLDAKKAKIAGLLHDCAKFQNNSEIINKLQKYGEKLDDIQKRAPKLLHGLLGYYVARDEYGISDLDILSAIYWHTTGRAGMTIFEKIIFVADYIEEGRSFQGIDEARKLAYQDLNQCILVCTDATIRHVLSKGDLLHHYTVETRNDALIKMSASKST